MSIFVSYNRRDAAHAKALDGWLREQGEKTFFDQRELGGGQLWYQDLQDAIDTVSSVAVLVGPSGLGNTQYYEFDYALIRRAREKGFPVIPVILPGAEDTQLTGFLELLTWIDTRGGNTPLAAPDELLRLLAAVRQEHISDTATRNLVCPYKGLTWFGEEDYRTFHGRDGEIKDLHEVLIQNPVAAVIGASGAGKSSLVQAGLLPRLRGLGQPIHHTVWDRIVVQPGTDPLQGLASALTPPAPGQVRPSDTATLEEQAAALAGGGPDRLANHIRHRKAQSRLRSRVSTNRLLIVLEQAEKLFVVPRHIIGREGISAFHRDADRVMALLLRVAEQGEASLVLTIRGDYYQNLISSPFGSYLRHSQFPVGPIRDPRPAIERPAEVVNLTLEPHLADTIIRDVGTDETNLPLMQHALEATWRAPRKGNMLTHQAYFAAGGVPEAIATSAEACYRSDLQSDAERDAARRLFLRLVRLDGTRTILREQAHLPTDLVEMRVMELFASQNRRLLRLSRREDEDAGVVELSHEALGRRWPRLREWAEA
jgi:hypothetical protein